MITADTAACQPDPSRADEPLGLRLRRAREAASWSVADVAERLRLKSSTVEAMEREDLASLGASVYVRGYFTSYARLVGVPPLLVDGIFARAESSLPELRTTARVSHARYLLDRYAMRSVYVVLTALIVVPVVLLATRNQLPTPGATLTPLDAPVPAQTRDPVVLPTPAGESLPPMTQRSPGSLPATLPPALPVAGGAESPVMASLTPFLAAPPAQAPIEAPAEDVKGLALTFIEDSWVEVIGRDGARLEFGLVRRGEERRFDLQEVERVALGNAAAVEVRMNGNLTDIAAFRRANVARFTVSSLGELAPAGG